MYASSYFTNNSGGYSLPDQRKYITHFPVWDPYFGGTVNASGALPNYSQPIFSCSMSQAVSQELNYKNTSEPPVNHFYPLEAVSQELNYKNTSEPPVNQVYLLEAVSQDHSHHNAPTQFVRDDGVDDGDLVLAKALESSPEPHENQYTTRCIEPRPELLDQVMTKKRKREEYNSNKKRKDLRPIEQYVEELLKMEHNEYYKTGVFLLNSLVGINPKKFHEHYTEMTGNMIKQNSLIQKFDPSRGSNHLKSNGPKFMKIKKIKRSAVTKNEKLNEKCSETIRKMDEVCEGIDFFITFRDWKLLDEEEFIYVPQRISKKKSSKSVVV